MFKFMCKSLISLFSISMLMTPLTVNADNTTQIQTATINDFAPNPSPLNPWIKDAHRPIRFKSKTITYRISDKQATNYQIAWQNAVQQWNNLGVIHLIPVHKNSNITFTGPNQEQASQPSNQQDDGDTVSKYAMHQKSKKYIWIEHSHSYFTLGANSDNLEIVKQVAEHELGHAIGFAHDRTINGNYKYIMYPYSGAGSYYPLGEHEKNTLQHYYH